MKAALLRLLLLAVLGSNPARAAEAPAGAASEAGSGSAAFPACNHGRPPPLLMHFQGRLELQIRASAAVEGRRQVDVEILKSTVDDRKVERRAIHLLSDWARQQPCRVDAFDTKVSYEAR